MRTTPLVCLAIAFTCAAQEYSIQEVPLPGALIGISLPYSHGIQSLNRRDQMLANFFSNETDTGGCFVFQGSGWEEITNQRGRSVFGISMNRHGDIVGQSPGDNDVTFAFVSSRGVTLEIPMENIPYASATSINDHGEVVGTYVPPRQDEERVFFYSKGRIRDLGRTIGGTLPLINNSGQISFAVLVSGRAGIVLLNKRSTNYVDGWQTFQFGMNNRGDVVGYARVKSTYPTEHAFLYRDGQTVDLQPEDEPFGVALAINDAREAVGWYQTPLPDGSNYDQGFLYSNGRRRKLSEIVKHDGSWDLGIPTAINSQGEIAGIGLHKGQAAAYLLTPLKRK